MTKFTSGFTSPCLAGASLALSIVGMATAQDPPRFRVTDLGNLGFVPNPVLEGTMGINNRGEVVFSMDVNGQRHAMLWLPVAAYGLPDPGNYDLGVLFPGTNHPSIARDISFQGKIVGQVDGVLAGEGQAMVWDLATGTLQPLGFLLPDGTWSRAFAISDAAFPLSSVVVGESEHLEVCRETCEAGPPPPPPPPPQIFWQSFYVPLGGTPTLIPLPSAGCDPSSLALDVSTVSGGTRIAGSSDQRRGFSTNCLPLGLCNMTSKDAVIWADPLVLMELPGLDEPDNFLDSEARGVNTAGQSASWVYKPDLPGAGC